MSPAAARLLATKREQAADTRRIATSFAPPIKEPAMTTKTLPELSPEWLGLASGYLDCSTADIGVSTVVLQGERILSDCAQWLDVDGFLAMAVELEELLAWAS